MGKMGKLCGLCFKVYSNLAQHLRVSHVVNNEEERKLLLKYGSARLQKPVDCPLCDRQKLSRLDKHLIDTHKISAAVERQDIVVQAKRAYFVKELAALRRTDPVVPMVSSLDTELHPEADHFDNLQPPVEEDILDCQHSAGDSTEQEGSPECLSPNPPAKSVSSESPADLTLQPPNTPMTTPESSAQGSSEHLPTSLSAASLSLESPTPLKPPNTALTSVESSWISPSSPNMKSTPSTSSMNVNVGMPRGGCDSLRREISEKLDNLMSRMDKVERKVQSLFMSPKKPFTPTESTQKAEKMVWPPQSSPSLYGRILLDFEEFWRGNQTSSRARDNVRLARIHVLHFIRFMLTDCRVKDEVNNLLFLNNMSRLRLWPSYLSEKGYQVSTIKNMMIDVGLFLHHVENCFLEESKLKSTDMRKILYEFKRLQATTAAKLSIVHQQQAMRQTTESQLNTAQQVHFMKVTRQRIACLMDDLYVDPNSVELNTKVMGYLMGYLAILTGHRSVVFTNMKKEHVKNAEEWDSGKKYLILVYDHKTVQSFGQASISLDKEEYDWLVMLEIISSRRKSGQTPYLFHHLDGQKVEKPNRFLENAWVDAGCTLPVEFSKIRSSVATQAHKHLNMEERKDVAKSMCHYVNTAEQFNVALPDKKAAQRRRKLQMKAFKLNAGSKGPKAGKSRKQGKKERTPTPSTSCAEVEVVLDDETEFSDTCTDSEFQMPKKKQFCPPSPKQSTLSESGHHKFSVSMVCTDQCAPHESGHHTLSIMMTSTDQLAQTLPGSHTSTIMEPETQQSVPPKTEDHAISIMESETQQSVPPKTEDHAISIMELQIQQYVPPKTEDHAISIMESEIQQSVTPKTEDHAISIMELEIQQYVPPKTEDHAISIMESETQQSVPPKTEDHAISIMVPETQQSVPPKTEDHAISIMESEIQQSVPPKTEDHAISIMVPETQQSAPPI